MMGFGGGSLDVIKHMMLNDLTAILGGDTNMIKD